MASTVLTRSKGKGKNAATIQYGTARKIRSYFSNFYHTTPSGVQDVALHGALGRTTMLSSPTNGLWLRRFMEGCHRHMGDIWHPDKQLTIEGLLASLSLLEDDWKRYEALQSRCMEIEVLVASLVIGFCRALWGEEIPKADLEQHLSKRLPEGLANSASPHVPIALLGRFKRQVTVKLFFLTLALIYASGIETGLRVTRLVASYRELGISSRPLFRVWTKSGIKGYRRAKVRDLDPLLHDVLKRVQNKSPHLISPDLNVAE
jgi:hypothetical protein